MNLPFTNVHAHVFNSQCAPDRFLRILPIPIVRHAPGLLKSAFDSKTGRKIIRGLSNFFSKRNSERRSDVDKYIAFLDVGTEASQLEVFRRAFEVARTYDSGARVVGLTLNMDHMDNHPSEKQISFDTQLEMVKDIKRYFPANFFPFLGIDPRHKGGMDLVEWARPYFETGTTDARTGKVYPYFCGLKLYPALGFFPFDPRLEQLYEYAEANNLPVMTHCTRSGSQYIGSEIETLISRDPPMIWMQGNQNISDSRDSIVKRIDAFYKKGWVKNSKIGKNDIACDLFGNPENYVPLLERFPKLKICLAHMGGSTEILLTDPATAKPDPVNTVDTPSWFARIKTMMVKYPNLYTDISYTLCDFENMKGDVYLKVIDFLNTPDNNGRLLKERVVFGTDFFMTEQENRESRLYHVTNTNLRTDMDLIARKNPQEFLMQPV